MRKIVLAISVGATLVALPQVAVAAGPNPNPRAEAACEANIFQQAANGVIAGGGPKAFSLAPTNCDHLYQELGVIGNGPPGSGGAP